MKVTIPEFVGKVDPEKFLNWLLIIERLFEYEDFFNEKKVKVAALKLRKYASL